MWINRIRKLFLTIWNILWGFGTNSYSLPLRVCVWGMFWRPGEMVSHFSAPRTMLHCVSVLFWLPASRRGRRKHNAVICSRAKKGPGKCLFTCRVNLFKFCSFSLSYRPATHSLLFFFTDFQLRFILKAILIRKTSVAWASCCPGNSGRWKSLQGHLNC